MRKHAIRWNFLILCALVAASAAAMGQTDAIAPPLHTDGYRIVDASGHPVRLTSVNWYGFDEKQFVAGGLDRAPLARIVRLIKRIGVNSVRLPWANETLERNPIVPDYAVEANPQFKGKHAMQVMDAVVDALAQAHIMVILDDHVSRADWCCSETDGNGLWYNAEYPETKWIGDWKIMARRYRNQPWVVGADLRNELRDGATWGGSNPKLDWHAAAERGGAAVLAANPHLLVIVEGPQYSTDFTGFEKLPVQLPIPHRLVYSPHAYYDARFRGMNYQQLSQAYGARALFLLHSKPAVPLWVGEFGTCQHLDCGANAEWFQMVIRLLQQHPLLSWSYWPLNGTQSGGATRTYGSVEGFGLLAPDYRHIEAKKVVTLLHTIEGQPAR